jgi:hypothetical protein
MVGSYDPHQRLDQRLFCFDVQDANLWISSVPVGGDGIEDQPEVATGARSERGG